MPFKKGQSGNKKGRPRGSKNTKTLELRDQLKTLLDSQFDTIQKDLAKLEPKDRINAYIKLIEYCVPKLQRTENIIDVSKLSNEQIDQLFDKALSKLKDHG